MSQILPLVAEAQSALRTAILRIQAPEDTDQVRVFEWVKATAARQRIYINRFMRSDDPADSTVWPDLLVRIAELQERHLQAGARSQERLLLEQLRQSLTGSQQRGPDDDWTEPARIVEELIRAGVPPSNKVLRDLLLPVIDEISELDTLPDGFQRVVREIDRFLAAQSTARQPSIAEERTPEVKAAARLLAGASMVLIGGSRRREAEEALERAFDLKDLIWVETKEHQAVGGFEPFIVRPDVAIVILAIRWSSHAFGDVKLICDRVGKPLVRLPGGYNPNQVAAQILAQCSAQLTGR
jgi:hypothetical protein